MKTAKEISDSFNPDAGKVRIGSLVRIVLRDGFGLRESKESSEPTITAGPEGGEYRRKALIGNYLGPNPEDSRNLLFQTKESREAEVRIGMVGDYKVLKHLKPPTVRI